MKMLKTMFQEINYAASLDNRFGHKMLAVCYGVMLFSISMAIVL